LKIPAKDLERQGQGPQGIMLLRPREMANRYIFSNIFEQLTGWWYTYPSEKYESQLGLLFPIYGT
jgi:hypothetical protein